MLAKKMKTKYFVVSLPRTGTTSLSKMARICGLNPKHAPHFYWKLHLKNDVFNFFSDTPIYSPQVIEEICNDDSFISKFIYIEKDYSQIFASWKKMGLFNTYSKHFGNEKHFDSVSYNQAFANQKLDDLNFVEVFSNHKSSVFEIIEKYSKDLLIYKFEQGWDPFCNFLSVDVPQEEIPHLNINTMFNPY
jgi:hypothetical protein